VPATAYPAAAPHFDLVRPDPGKPVEHRHLRLVQRLDLAGLALVVKLLPLDLLIEIPNGSIAAVGDRLTTP
jgi:hypothetical protein